MRTIDGRTDHVVVVGAGLAGLSAALHLAGRGRAVTVVEREPWPGGRAGRLDIDGYRIDTGPTVLTMPDIIDETFAAVGETTSDRLELSPVDPAYRAVFADGSALDVHSDADRMADAIADFAGSGQAAGYRRLRTWLTRLYRTEFDGFIGANFDSPLSLLTPRLAQLTAIGGFRRWDRMVKRHISDERLQRIFTFQSLYAGVAPRDALAVYAVIAYMDTIAGVVFPRGGVRALPDALAAAATDAGVQFRYGATVTALEQSGGRVRAVLTEQAGRISCDAIVLTTELPQTYALLGRTPRRAVRLRASPSAVVAHLGCPAVARDTAHHTILFGEAWDQTFTDIIRDGRLMTDPSLLVTRPTAGDPALAPEGRDLLYVLAPAPNLERGTIDWSRAGAAYAEGLVAHVADRLLPGLREDATVLDVVTPADWARQGMAAGSPFALAHTFGQTGPFRPANMVRGIDNAVLAGSSTVPGVGVPTTLISGRLAADRITGAATRAIAVLDTKAGLP
ncbi:phytoene desaturase family protein [Mycobacterium intracellulare]|uniref:Phytoene dehydrogenase n=3 Tax=Mycobacterium intracellulare TaxID=1767 RepID=A0A1Y0TCF7_MYCIT|nr:phytoene desaturase family protein [Mycobacterium intracellulare]ARV83539.1 phytoene dehydrogenase [Mycobacterium intracellulare subsp. chimaera]ASL10764.1 phytoene dehydrogenase [Mycobacterium intracellulare subsp. chimaera]ASL16654.1 phytoene dehydrogenase [Mycobacterium intracellulare subsp. chimaera]ASL22706.1 phytoene dehydrogenase [Mycobacterium intracellulare subsp. chimaera]ASQ87676.1 phytoene desaturase [Mycobacterium intracellulare subsp. chimaera]